MQVIKSIKKMAEVAGEQRYKGSSMGFVPTMGALHEGHLSLIRRARRENNFVVVSIFVNPVQFGPKEDLKKYPRNLRRDTILCKREKADALFCPDVKEMYPENYKTFVEVYNLSRRLCGEFRPGHFKGVATAVTKLFNILRPDTAYFGQKDAQQAIIIKRMAEDLNMPIKVKVMPTKRTKDGLAMSSRNTYLNVQEREDAAVLFQSLNLANELVGNGENDADRIIRKMKGLIRTKRSAKIDYVDIVDLEKLEHVNKITGNCLIALAAWIGKTRLIDNIIIRQ